MQIKNIETNKIFNLSDAEALLVLASNKERFIIVDTNGQPTEENVKNDSLQGYKFEDMTVAELKDYCTDNDITFKAKATKNDLIKLIVKG